MTAHGVRQRAVRHQLVPAVARPWLRDPDAPAVARDPHHVGLPRARLREHLERERLVVRRIAGRDERELRAHHPEDHDPAADDPHETASAGRARRRQISQPISTSAGAVVFGKESTKRNIWFHASATGSMTTAATSCGPRSAARIAPTRPETK